MSELAISNDNIVALTGEEQLVTMKVGDQLFGLPILSAQDIVETQRITQVPMAPSAVAGVMNLRGRIVTVVNLRRILAQEENFASRMGVTVEHDGDLYTILVDEIGEVMSIAGEDLEPVPTTLSSGLKSLCSGIYRLENGLLALLDIDRILDADTILQTPQIDFVARKRLLKELEDEAIENVQRTEVMDEAGADGPATKESGGMDQRSREETFAGREAAGAAPPADASPPPQSEQSSAKSLYQRIGGAPAIEAAAERFRERATRDESLAGSFEGVDPQRRRKVLDDLVTMAVGEPDREDGIASGAAFVRLFNENGRGKERFDAVAGHLRATLKDMDVADDMIEEALSRVRDIWSGTRGD